MTEEAEKLTEAYYDKAQKTETWSGIPLKELYTPEDIEGNDYQRDIADAGEYPFTRGIHRNMYRGKYPTRRILCGFGSPADTNKRLKYNIEAGFTGLDVFPDLAGMLCLDADHPRAAGEVGVQGVSVSSLQDFEEVVEGIPLDKMTVNWRTFLTIPYIAIMAERQGINLTDIRGTVLNWYPLAWKWVYGSPDGFQSFELQKKLAVDTVEYCTKNMPNFYATYIDGYNLREYGLSAPQELAWIFSQAIDYIDCILGRGLHIDEFGPRITFFMTSLKDFFEEIAKFRAARRMWAKITKERYGAKDPRTMKLRFASYAAGSSLTAQQPLNNIVRITYQGMAAMLGGVQSMSLPSYLEAVSLPTEESARLAIRTQQILAYESGIPNVSDPLGGSYYVEYLTSKVEEESNKILREIEELGGITEAARAGWVDQMIDKAALQRQKEVENKERIVVGLNAFNIDEDKTPGGYFRNPTHAHESAKGKEMVARVKRLKETRDNKKVKETLGNLRARVKEGERVNLIPAVIEAAKTYATHGEIMGTIREAYGLKYDPFDEIESPFQLQDRRLKG